MSRRCRQNIKAKMCHFRITATHEPQSTHQSKTKIWISLLQSRWSFTNFQEPIHNLSIPKKRVRTNSNHHSKHSSKMHIKTTTQPTGRPFITYTIIKIIHMCGTPKLLNSDNQAQTVWRYNLLSFPLVNKLSNQQHLSKTDHHFATWSLSLNLKRIQTHPEVCRKHQVAWFLYKYTRKCLDIWLRPKLHV